jgi:hypothetical protein
VLSNTEVIQQLQGAGDKNALRNIVEKANGTESNSSVKRVLMWLGETTGGTESSSSVRRVLMWLGETTGQSERNFEFARCEFLAAVLLNIRIFRDVTSCRLVDSYRHFEVCSFFIFALK